MPYVKGVGKFPYTKAGKKKAAAAKKRMTKKKPRAKA